MTWQWWLRSLGWLLAATLICIVILGAAMSGATTTAKTRPDWSSPAVMALKRVSTLPSSQSEPNFLNNLDCSLVTYRVAATKEMRTGCFTPTAIGMMDSDTELVIFNGTDEALPIIAYAPHQILAPWPKAMDLVSLSPVSTGGSRIGLYKNPAAVLQDQRNLLLQLTSKQMTAPAELPLTDNAGQPLVINEQSLAFSDGGGWLVAETLNGSFVRINLATLEVKAFAKAFGSQGSPALLKSRVAISDNGQYVAIANAAADSFKVYDLGVCSGTSVNLQPENCPAYEYKPFVSQQIAGLRSIRHLRFVNDGLLSFETSMVDPTQAGIYELAPTTSIDSLIDYLGLGDSYTSGEGAFNYSDGTDTANNKCHLSIKSYPLLLARDIFSNRGGRSVACSGAVINDVGNNSDDYRGQVRTYNPALFDSVMTNFVPGYVSQEKFARQYQPGVITASVGGNDIGFGDIVKSCAMPHVSRHLSDNVCFNTYEDRLEVTEQIDRTVPRWTALYKQLALASPASRLYAIGYPEIADDTGNCALNVNLSKSELEFSITLVNYLNKAIQQATAAAGITYVDIDKALYGHRLCETISSNVAVNGLTAGTDSGIIGSESYHPNALGHELIEQAILKQTHNLTIAPAPALPVDTSNILKAPKSGRAITNRVPVSSLVTPVMALSKVVTIKAGGAPNGLKPHNTYSVRIDGSVGAVIGTAVADDTGNVDTSVTIPPGTEPGSHAIDVTGENQAGQAIDLTTPIYLPASNSDADDDGIPDTTDSCPTAINSGIDTDKDHIDDTCDGFIGVAPGSGSGSSTPSWTAAVSGQLLLPPAVTIAGKFNASRPAGHRLDTKSLQPTMPSAIASVQRHHKQSRLSHELLVPILGSLVLLAGWWLWYFGWWPSRPLYVISTRS